ncbi:hypothetical protein Btru_052872 [Bulinus truncatus]|nr:hypothetical protein Btru_052872 [Bulinus truncatus]
MEVNFNLNASARGSRYCVTTPLHRAVSRGNKDEVRRLLAEGVDVDSRDGGGETPLHRAAAYNRLSIIKILVEHGATINAPNHYGEIPLMNVFSESTRTASLLLKLGANVNYIDPRGWSPLMMAVRRLNRRYISVLLKEGADVNITAIEKGRPISSLSLLLNKWYAEKKVEGIALELLRYGASVTYVRNDAIHRLVGVGSVELVHEIVLRGVCPTDIVLKKEIFDCPLLTISPLTLCLALNRLELATYFIDNWFLTRTDVKVLSRNMQIMNYLNFLDSVHGLVVGQLVMKISSQPLKLVVLSFIAVSTVVGSGPDREEKVERTGLPQDLRDRLMYRNVYRNVEMAPIKESKEYGSSERERIYRELTKQQVFETKPDARYYSTYDAYFEESDPEDEDEMDDGDDDDMETDDLGQQAEELEIEKESEEEGDFDDSDEEEDFNESFEEKESDFDESGEEEDSDIDDFE